MLGHPMRRLRATFRLRCVLAAFCIALPACVLILGQSTGWTLGTLALAAILWFVGIEAGLLPLALEYVAVRRAAQSGRPVSSTWFVDLDEQQRKGMQAFHDDTSDNPTIR